jgi:hypothetical protein
VSPMYYPMFHPLTLLKRYSSRIVLILLKGFDKDRPYQIYK